MQNIRGYLAIPKKLTKNYRLLIPAIMLKNFDKNQLFKVETIDNYIKLTAVQNTINKTDVELQKKVRRFGLEYTMPLEQGCLLLVTEGMRERLKLEAAITFMVVYEDTQEIFVIPQKSKCAFCQKTINSMEEKTIISTAAGRKKAICNECAQRLVDDK